MKGVELSITPIGGVGEIGSNFTLIEVGESQIIIDCGILFPYEDFFNINYLIPDFSLISKDRLVAIIITHGHEDHIGALPHFISSFPDTLIYTTNFTENLIRKKFQDLKVNLRIKSYCANDQLSFDNLTILPVHVTHSIPETMGLILKTSSWTTLFISDFKVDLKPSFEKSFDLDQISDHFNSDKNKIAFLDSTNILNPHKTLGEDDLHADLESIVGAPNRRIFITLFASNIHRIQRIYDLAQKYKRSFFVLGRSLENYIEAGIESKILDIEFRSARDIPPGQSEGSMVVLVSGCQGDHFSALRRLSAGEDSIFKLTAEDVVVFSSKVIPGNEKKISRIYNDISNFGSTIITAHEKIIHASGHPGQEDLKILLDKIQFDYVIPIHGESYFLDKHIQFLQKNYPLIRPLKILNYYTVRLFVDGKVKTEINKPVEPRIIHGKMLEIERSRISERRKMATTGVVFVSLLKSKYMFHLSTQGLPISIDEKSEQLKTALVSYYQTHLVNRDDSYIQDQLRIHVRQFYQAILGYKPLTIIHLV